MILLLDNYDSFVYNLARYFARLGHATHVVRSDAIDAAGVRALRPRAIAISPGPCTPAEAGCSQEVVRQLGPHVPILGVCLGHQAIAAALGGKVVRAEQPMHGRTSEVYHHGQGIFSGDLPHPFIACRYHSLVVEEDTLPDCLEVTARTADGVVMAVAHRRWKTFGVQFHPESILTAVGYQVLAGFLRQAELPVPAALPSLDDEQLRPAIAEAAWPQTPVTF